MQPTFVVMTDFSAAAEAALAYTTRLATLVDGQVLLLHVFEDHAMNSVNFAPGPAFGQSGTLTRHRVSREAVLAELTREAQLLPVPAEVELMEPPMGDALHHLLAHRYPQLLVLGRAHAHAWFAHLLTQSHKAATLGATHIPVLLVPEDWPRPELPQHLVVAADGAPLALTPATQDLAPLLTRLHPAVTVVHIAAHAHGPSRAAEALEAVRETGLFGPLDGNSLYEEREVGPVAGLLQAANEVGADLLVVMPRPHFFPGNLFHHDVTADLLRRSPVPVLVLPAVA
ncbi:universal stress protein [Hymenobacter negativus]|uniref:Universal stress protein n=1 Tax=Hymenobacter negativus TaxID=2795026 RepID=A0ABS0Q6D5_9BACT|nr:universal stress protein [Hymenobacter negativus]MBH8558137.1 universal stress protein [Hymenobacter negativus]